MFGRKRASTPEPSVAPVSNRPRWIYTLDVSDVFHDDAVPFERKAQVISERLLASSWLRTEEPEGGPVTHLAWDLSEAPDPEEFDLIWNEVYNYANVDRCWIVTRR